MSATSGSVPGCPRCAARLPGLGGSANPDRSLCLQEGVLEPNPVRNFLDDPQRRSGPLEEPERDRREGSRRHGRNWGGSDFERVRCGLEQERQVGAGSGGTLGQTPFCSQNLTSANGPGRVLSARRSQERGRAGRGSDWLALTPRDLLALCWDHTAFFLIPECQALS